MNQEQKEPTIREFYLYGAICDDKIDESDITPADFLNETADLTSGDVLNLYINSPGGSVFAMSAMVSQIKRLQEKGTVINAYVDGVAASAASVLAMAADTVTMYSNSMLMIHKPWMAAIGNADDFIKAAEDLENIENAVMMPVYKSKSLVDDEEIKAIVAKETWMGATEASQAFNIAVSEEEKQAAAFAPEMFNAEHVPESLCAMYTEQKEKKTDPEETLIKPVDLTAYKKRISEL